MTKSRLRIPVGLFIAIAVTFILGLVATPAIKALTTEEQRSTNVLLSAIPFILIFVAILLTRISGIPLLQKKADKKWGGQADYEAFKKNTPVLIPKLWK
jgi:steroid 5-alpha reductase family enzyme